MMSEILDNLIKLEMINLFCAKCEGKADRLSDDGLCPWCFDEQEREDTQSVWVAAFIDGVASLNGEVLEFATKSEASKWIREHISINSRAEDKWAPALLVKGAN
jgi:hypothetical protein